MAEAIAVISFVSALFALADYGTKVLQRLNECKTSVRDLPRSFSHIRNQLPLLIGTVNDLRSRANAGGLSPETETALRLVVEGILAEVKGLNSILVKVVPSNTASNWEKGLKAIKSLGYQKTVDDFASVIEGYVSNLTLYQATYNGDLIKILINLVEQKSSRRPQEVQVTLRRKPCFMVRHQIDEDFVGREEIMEEIQRRFRTINRVAITGLSGVGYAFLELL